MAVRTTPRAHLQTPQDPRLARIVCCAAALGTTSPAAAVARSAAPATRTSPASLSGSVPSGLRNSLFSFSFSIFSGNSPRSSPRMRVSFYFPKPWRPPWFGGYEGCCRAVSPTGCGNFLKSKNDSWTIPRPSPRRAGLFRSLHRGGVKLLSVDHQTPQAFLIHSNGMRRKWNEKVQQSKNKIVKLFLKFKLAF